jgi:hypothetical protein
MIRMRRAHPYATAWFIVAVGLGAARAQAPSTPRLAGNAANPTLLIQVEHPILLFGEKPGTPVRTAIGAKTLNFPPDARLTYAWQQVEDALSPVAAPMDKGKKIVFSSTDAASTVATFPDWGVYAIRLTVTDAKGGTAASRNVWVNVWDSRPHIVVDGKADPLCPAPGLTPPPSVRALSSDPGPFAHPRIYCTDADWPEISQRCAKGILASKALAILQQNAAKGIDAPQSEPGKLTAKLEAYADAGYAGEAPDLTMGVPAEMKDGKPDWGKAAGKLNDYMRSLRDACFVAWVSLDPSKPRDQAAPEEKARRRRLAKALAAASRLRLRGSWDPESGQFKKDAPLYIDGLDQLGDRLAHFESWALAYDFIAPWMTAEEQREARNLLFATSVGRTTGARGLHTQVNGVSQNRGVERGLQQNGEFMNIEEERIVTALCIAGEEGGVDPKVVQAFTALPKPADFEKSGKCFAYDWVRPADADTGRDHPASRPYPVGSTWPHARKVEVDNLQRVIWWSDDAYTSPWGFMMNREAYYGFSALGIWPAAVAYARHGASNLYVTSYFYPTVNHLVYHYYPGAVTQKSDHFQSNTYMYDHHDGGGDYRQAHVLLLKYMYPDDPLVDYIYAANAPSFEQSVFNPFNTALFGLDPGINGKTPTLPETAKQKALPLTKLDPQEGVVVTRSGWEENDAVLYFDEGWKNTGHMHAEKNNFSFYAVGRPWSIPPGYHIVESNYQSLVSIQDPAFAADPETEGYVGESPGIIPAGSAYPKCFPTPPGHLIEVKDGPDRLHTLMAGDAKTAYDYSFGGANKAVEPEKKRAQHQYPGLLDDLLARWPGGRYVYAESRNAHFGMPETLNPGYNPVKYVFRTILFVRGRRPYALVVDDINKDGTPRNYRWAINCTNAFGPPSGCFADAQGRPTASSLILAPGATATDATLLHLPDQGDQPGLPRLLLRDCAELDNRSQPAMHILTRIGKDVPAGQPPSNRVFVDRNGVVEPRYTMLLFPYRTGEKIPVTAWDGAKRTLTVDLKDGTVDAVTFDRGNADHRTRLAFQRRGGGR